MTALSIVGAAGSVGRPIIKYILDHDSSLRTFALLRRPDAELARLDRCEVVEGGIFDQRALERVVKDCDLVINLAARNPTSVDEDWASREDFFLLNGLGAGLVAEAAQRHQRPLIHFSTVSVYETAAYAAGHRMTESERMPCLGMEIADFYERTLRLLSERIAEQVSRFRTDLLADDFKQHLAQQSYPASTPIYGLSKLIGETLALQLCQSVCSVRMSDVYGPGHESRGLVIDHLNQLRFSNTATVDLSPRTGVYLVFVDDVARFLGLLVDRLLSNDATVPRILNFCGERIDRAAMRSHLQDICDTRRLSCNVDTVAPTMPQFDRCYSSEVVDRRFPAFDKTDFGSGIQISFKALDTKIQP